MGIRIHQGKPYEVPDEWLKYHTKRTRVRKGKVVTIPDEWIGCVTSRQTKVNRREMSKLKRKDRRRRLKRASIQAFNDEQGLSFSRQR